MGKRKFLKKFLNNIKIGLDGIIFLILSFWAKAVMAQSSNLGITYGMNMSLYGNATYSEREAYYILAKIIFYFFLIPIFLIVGIIIVYKRRAKKRRLKDKEKISINDSKANKKFN